VAGWITSASRKDVAFARRFLRVKRNKDIPAAMIEAALGSVADTAVIPIQDYLELDNSARINVPSTLGTNWKWRLVKGQLTDELAERMAELTKVYNRNR
jgi:4-alpha-glucanotransferase